MNDIYNLPIPVICLRGLTPYPFTDFSFDIARERSVNAYLASKVTDNTIFLVTQRLDDIEEPTRADVFDVGVYAHIISAVPHGDGDVITLNCTLDVRAKVETFAELDNTSFCTTSPYEDSPKEILPEKKKDAYRYRLRDAFLRYAFYRNQMTPHPYDMPDTHIFDGKFENLSYEIAMRLPLENGFAQKVLESTSPCERAELMLQYLYTENERLELEVEINGRVQDALDKNNRDYFLHETINQINKELGEDDESDIAKYRSQLSSLDIDDKIREKITKEINRLSGIPAMSPDGAVLRAYIEKVLELPWNTQTKDNFNIKHARRVLDEDHYGMNDVKDSVLETLTAYKYSENMSGQILCLAGPPGVGKTSIASSVAKAMGRKFARVSLGGVRDEAEIRGHRRTYVGSMPGRIISAVIDCGTNNPVILLDEVDKLSNDYKGDPSAALLEVLDPAQNSTFTDHYIDLPFDLSHVLFITTANERDQIPAPLLDRMDIIELDSYTESEKVQIARRHLVKRALKKYNLKASDIKINTKAIEILIENYTREAGVRQLERLIDKCLRRFLMKSDETVRPLTVTRETIEEYLGKAKYIKETRQSEMQKGTVNGLAWTSVGGEVLKIECLCLDGTGKIELTGSLGDVMKESARIAVSVARSLAPTYGYSPDFYKEKDIHLHFPDGATKKDGPSAGVAIVTSLVSALSGKCVRSDVAVTGEVDILGNVLPIGGLKEKSMAAYRYKVTKCVIPRKNESDLEKVNDDVKENVEFVLVDKVEDALENLLV